MSYKTIEIDGEKFYEVNNQWVDSTFIIAPTSILRKIINYELAQLDINNLNIKQVKIFIEKAKKSECYDICLGLIENLLQKAFTINDIDTFKFYISVKCSCLRNLNKPQEAIEFCEQIKREFGSDILNVAALTSLAAAYCDIENWDYARKVCNYAYKMQGGSVGYNNELSMVYKRIEANIK